jgi:hypothetical protein
MKSIKEQWDLGLLEQRCDLEDQTPQVVAASVPIHQEVQPHLRMLGNWQKCATFLVFVGWVGVELNGVCSGVKWCADGAGLCGFFQ